MLITIIIIIIIIIIITTTVTKLKRGLVLLHKASYSHESSSTTMLKLNPQLVFRRLRSKAQTSPSSLQLLRRAQMR